MLNSRQENLLKSVVEEFIETAKPVSSRLLENFGFLGLSSATIRNEMAELEDMGFLTHLHTSGGRLPTDAAYRYFVDNLIEPADLEPIPSVRSRIVRTISGAGSDSRILNKAVAQLLSDLSDNIVITRLEETDEFYKTGISSLFEMPEFKELQRVCKLTSFFDEFECLFNEIEEAVFGCVSRAGIKTQPLGGFRNESGDDDIPRVFIGQESPFRDIKDETVIFTRYDLPDNYTGFLTLIGPTRMDYKRNIGLVKFTKGELNKAARRT